MMSANDGHKITRAILHQYGKTGSSTIKKTLENAPGSLKTYFAHFLSSGYFDFFNGFAARNDIPPRMKGSLKGVIAAANEARECILEADPADICVITGFRNPYEYAVSAFFQNIYFFMPDLTYAPERLNEETSQVMDFFEKVINSDVARGGGASVEALGDCLTRSIPLEWFEREFAEVYGIDPYGVDVADKDVICFTSQGMRFVWYRYETFLENLPSILAPLSLGEIRRHDANVSAVKEYGPLMREFKRRFTLDRRMRAFYCDNRFYRHFYGKAAAGGPRRQGGHITTISQE